MVGETGQPDKRRAILDGALRLFARDGYSRANVDGIAAAAGVSNRTVYNHFKDKAHLFEAVIQDSSGRVAETQLAIIARHLGESGGLDGQAGLGRLEDRLVAFGIEWLAVLDSDLAPHFALVRQVNADLEHIPTAAVEAWQETGPRRVRRVLAEHLSALTDNGHVPALAPRGALRVADPERAAVHLLLLISADNLRHRGDPAEVAAMVAAGVTAFLHGYAKG